jgi:hypothetical protein
MGRLFKPFSEGCEWKPSNDKSDPQKSDRPTAGCERVRRAILLGVSFLERVARHGGFVQLLVCNPSIRHNAFAPGVEFRQGFCCLPGS